MSKEIKFLKYAFILTPWIFAITTAILFTYLQNYPESDYYNLSEKFKTIISWLLILWLGSLVFSLFLLISLFTKEIRIKYWKESAILFCGHISYLVLLNAVIFDWLND